MQPSPPTTQNTLSQILSLGTCGTLHMLIKFVSRLFCVRLCISTPLQAVYCGVQSLEAVYLNWLLPSALTTKHMNNQTTDQSSSQCPRAERQNVLKATRFNNMNIVIKIGKETHARELHAPDSMSFWHQWMLRSLFDNTFDENWW